MSWTIEQIEDHKQAAELLDKIKDEALRFIKSKPSITEYEAQQFILKRFKENKMITDRDSAIVAFRKNTAYVHYYPVEDCLRLEPDSLIMVDLWAKLDKEDAPYADITWMAYYGQRFDQEVLKVFGLVVKSRNQAVKFIRNCLEKGDLPAGKAVDKAARDLIEAAGYGARFLHTTGHSLDIDSPHGKEFGLNKRNAHQLKKNLGYTIEPGIYLDGRFGIRSEIDFFIDDGLQLVITGKIQKELIII